MYVKQRVDGSDYGSKFDKLSNNKRAPGITFGTGSRSNSFSNKEYCESKEEKSVDGAYYENSIREVEIVESNATRRV